MLKILIGLILVLFFFVALFFNKIREALSTGGMAVLLVIMLALSGVAGWLGFVDSGRQKTGTAEVAATKAGRFSPAAEAPSQSVVVPGGGVSGTAEPVRGASTENATQSLQEIYERVSPSVVVVYNLNGSGQIRGHGTGFFIDPWGMVATNYHVVEGASSLKIKTKSGMMMDIKGVAATDPDNDVVILSAILPIDAIRTLRMAPELPQVGERIAVIGTPYHPQLAQTITDGIVSALRPIPGGRQLIQISAPISPGSSGSPVVNMKGEVIGIASRVHRQAPYIGIAVPGQIISGLTPSVPFPVARLPVLYADQIAMTEPSAPQPNEAQRRLEEERRRALEQRARVQEEQRNWREQQIGEAVDLFDKAKHNMSFDRYDLAFSQYERALQIFRGVGETQAMAACLEQMGVIMQKRGRQDVASEYFRQAATMRAQR